jgi:hypothetical protein
MCGFFAIPRSRLLELAPPASGFKIAFETIVHGGRTLRVREIPIAFRDRVRGKSKMSFGVALQFLLRWSRAMLRHFVRRPYRPEHAAGSIITNVPIDPESFRG